MQCASVKNIVRKGYLVNLITNGITAATQKRLFDNKQRTRQWLLQHGLPAVPEVNYKEIDPLSIIVIKPYNGTRGDGIHIGERKDLPAVLPNNYLAEKYIVGQHFRVVMHQQHVVGVLKRIPAHVVGNGHDNVRVLIEGENERRCAGRMLMCDTICKRTLQQVLPQGVAMDVNRLSNYAKGGTVEIVTAIHPDFIALWEKLARMTPVTLFGIDFIVPDITAPLADQQCAINELELFNDIDIHFLTRDRVYDLYCRLYTRITWNLSISIAVLFACLGMLGVVLLLYTAT
jgi:cyanophycin synthetase